MKNTPNKSYPQNKEEIPTSHKVPQSSNTNSGIKHQATKEKATTDSEQLDFENEPKRKPDPSRYTEEE